MRLSSFSALVSSYKAIFFDAYGVLKNSQGVLEGVVELLAWLTQQGKDVYVLTNDASRSPRQMANAYTHARYGELIPPARIISSGLLAKDYLRSKIKQGTAVYLGKPGAAFYIESAGLNPLPISDYQPKHPVDAVALLDDEGFDWFRDLNLTVNLLRRTSVPVVVANPDLSYPVNNHEIGLAVGSLARMLEEIVGKTFTYFGKPDTMMYAYAFTCAVANNPDLQKSDILMVGDTLRTDIVGADNFGLDTALVLSGNTLPEEAEVRIRASGIIPTHVCQSVLT
jgi:HAD superfamily hydrolase (TIGR01450 family)